MGKWSSLNRLRLHFSDHLEWCKENSSQKKEGWSFPSVKLIGFLYTCLIVWRRWMSSSWGMGSLSTCPKKYRFARSQNQVYAPSINHLKRSIIGLSFVKGQSSAWISRWVVLLICRRFRYFSRIFLVCLVVFGEKMPGIWWLLDPSFGWLCFVF